MAGIDWNQSPEDAFKRLKAEMKLPCKVTGIEDFNWEEAYIFGQWDADEYETLKKTQPSFEDEYELLEISNDWGSQWMLFGFEDIGARARRISDGCEFILGLAELKAVDAGAPNAALIEDYAVWFVNSR